MEIGDDMRGVRSGKGVDVKAIYIDLVSSPGIATNLPFDLQPQKHIVEGALKQVEEGMIVDRELQDRIHHHHHHYHHRHYHQ